MRLNRGSRRALTFRKTHAPKEPAQSRENDCECNREVGGSQIAYGAYPSADSNLKVFRCRFG